MRSFYKSFLSGEVMPKSQTKKAVQARNWREKARNKRQLNNVLASYVQFKYKSIYNECNELYLALKKKYPLLGPKCNLTKTPMFRRLVATIDSSDSEESSTEARNTSTPSSADSNATETISINPASIDNNATETNPASIDNNATKTSPTLSEYNAIPDHSEMITVNPTGVQPETIPVVHLHVGYNAYGELVDQLTNEGEYVNMHNVNDEDFNDVVRELERDDEIQRLLNEIEVQPLEEPVDIDEGIELCIQNEDDDFDSLFDF